MALHIKAGGSWLPAKAVRVRVAGTWTLAKTVRQRIGGTWTTIWTALTVSIPHIQGTNQPVGQALVITGGTGPYTITAMSATPNVVGGGGQPLIYNIQDVVYVTYNGIGSGTVSITIADSGGLTATCSGTYSFSGPPQE